MFVIRRSDKGYSNINVNDVTTIKIHETLDYAEKEASRLATKHASEEPIFIIFELKQTKVISARIKISTQNIVTMKTKNDIVTQEKNPPTRFQLIAEAERYKELWENSQKEVTKLALENDKLEEKRE